jgi:hypothetical protein
MRRRVAGMNQQRITTSAPPARACSVVDDHRSSKFASGFVGGLAAGLPSFFSSDAK